MDADRAHVGAAGAAYTNSNLADLTQECELSVKDAGLMVQVLGG